jgi:hypothetical protein
MITLDGAAAFEMHAGKRYNCRSQNRTAAMNDDTRDLDPADTQILTPQLPDEALEAAAGTMAGTIPTGSVNIIPPNCC